MINVRIKERSINLIDATTSTKLPSYSWRCIAIDLDDALAQFESCHGKEFQNGDIILFKDVCKNQVCNTYWMDLSKEEFNDLRSKRISEN